MPVLLRDHEDIRHWASARGGYPMLMDTPDPEGDRTLLEITFGQHALDADGNEGPDRATGGFRLVGWDEWFTELDRQGLILKVNDPVPGALDNDFEFVAARGAGQTTDAARQPPVAGVEAPGQQIDPDRKG
ncbi:MAG TPA: hypothetical protein VFO41_08055 [Alphaproteobacteria bacterium]|nr:hypothetical protein [Alphaproteobacteria bacterium]